MFDNGKEIIGEVKNFLQGKLKFDTDQADNDLHRVGIRPLPHLFGFLRGLRRERGGLLREPRDHGRNATAGGHRRGRLGRSRHGHRCRVRRRSRRAFVERLDGNIDLGLSYTSADSSLQYSLDAAATYRQRKYSGSVSLTSIQTRRDGADDILRDNLTFDYTRYHWKRYFGTGTLEFSRNTELGIDLRTELGYAFGRYALVSNRQQLSGRVGFSITCEDDNRCRVRARRTRGAWSVSSYHFFLYHYPETDIVVDISVQPSITDWSRTRVNLNLSLRREFLEDFTVSLSVYDNYDSEPNRGRPGQTRSRGGAVDRMVVLAGVVRRPLNSEFGYRNSGTIRNSDYIAPSHHRTHHKPQIPQIDADSSHRRFAFRIFHPSKTRRESRAIVVQASRLHDSTDIEEVRARRPHHNIAADVSRRSREIWLSVFPRRPGRSGPQLLPQR